jgi:ElaB/YqjD/DUF883 family membrane-anchored ribosome-binding protein
MATDTIAKGVEAVKERLSPTLDRLDETMRQSRKIAARGQRAAEDATAATALRIRRQPLSAVMIAASAGVLVGVLVAFGVGQLTRSRR